MQRSTTSLSAAISQTLLELSQSHHNQLSTNLVQKLANLENNTKQQILLSEEEVERLLDLLPPPVANPDPKQAALQALREHLQQFLWQMRRQSPPLA